MALAFWLARCPRSTICDFVAIAQLKIVDSREHEHVTCKHTVSVKQLELACQTSAMVFTNDDYHAEGGQITSTDL